MACTIVGDLTGGNVPVGGGLAFAVTTQPIGAQSIGRAISVMIRTFFKMDISL
jgi:hypothetical protein